MSVTVRIPTQLRALTGGDGEIDGRRHRRSARRSKALDAAHPGIGERLLDDAGQLRRFVNVFLADEDVRFLDGLDTPVDRRSDALHRPGGRRRLTSPGPTGGPRALRLRPRRGLLLALDEREC